MIDGIEITYNQADRVVVARIPRHCNRQIATCAGEGSG